MQNISEYPGPIYMALTYLDLLYRFDRRISGDDYTNICLAVAQRMLL